MRSAVRPRQAGAGGGALIRSGRRRLGWRSGTPRGVAIATIVAILALVPAAKAAPPNVLFIVTDDQALETMDITDPAMDPMPKTKQWFHTGGTSQFGDFGGGTWYRDAVATTPLCCPARASIFTGRYAHNHGVLTNVDSPGPPLTHVPTGGSALDTSTTLARYLHDAGYYTGIFGKYLNGWDLSRKPDDPYPNWDEWGIYDNPGAAGGYDVNDMGTRKFEFGFETDYVKGRALDFLDRAKSDRDSTPWFLYIAPTAPHAPFAAAPRHAGLPEPPLDESDPAFAEGDRSDKGPWTQTTTLDADTPIRGWPEHLRMLRAVDEMVDDVMKKLQSQDEDRATIAFFISDNGLLWGEHGLYGKNLAYSESVRVPFMLRWPDGPVADNTTSHRLVSIVDMAPTVVDAVNDASGSEVIPPNPNAPMDGMSLIDPAQPDRDAILTEGWGMGPPDGTRGYCLGVAPTWAALTTRDFHYIEDYETRPIPPPGSTTPPPGCSAREYETRFDNPPLFREYYDTRAGHDPGELTNLLADENAAPTGTLAQLTQLNDDGHPENDPPTTALHNRLAALRTCEGQTCVPQPASPAAIPIEVAITGKPSDPSGFRDPTFHFSSTEPTARFRCALDAAPSRPCNSGEVTYTGLRNGRHRFRVQGSANGTTQTKLYLWVVDRESPDARIEGRPRKVEPQEDATFSFSGSEAAGSFMCQLDNDAPAPCTSPYEIASVADGTHTFTVTAEGSGAQDPTPATFKWQVDTRAPDTSITRSATFSSNNTGASFSFGRTFASGDPGLLGRFECQLDDGPWKSCESSKSFFGLPAGHHAVRVRAVDAVGNTDATPAQDEWDLGPIQTFGNMADTTWPEVSQGAAVNDIVADGSGGWYVAGDFTKLRDAGGNEHDHTNLVHITSAKAVDDAWNASTDGPVNSIVLSPDRSTLYVGGSFSRVGTSAAVQDTDRARLAAFSTTTGAPTTWDPGANNEVARLVLPPQTFGITPTTLYAAGSFSTLRPGGGASFIRRKVAELSLTGTGDPTGWNPNINSGATLLAMAVSERYVFVGGNMSSVGGSPSPNPLVSRTNLAALDRLDGSAADWTPDPNGTVFALHLTIRDETLDTILAGGSFDTIGNPPVSRSHAAEINLADDGSVTGWDPSLDIGGQPGSARSFISFGCHFTNPKLTEPSCATLIGGAFDSVRAGPGAGTATRIRLAQVERDSGFAQDWSPNLDQVALALACWPSAVPGGVGGRCDNALGRVLAVGGTFNTVGTVPRGRLAFFTSP